MDEERKCLACGAKIIGRSDKKFCSDMCRHDWHNRKNRQDRQSTEAVNAVLLKNLRILQRLLASGQTEISVENLAYQQFNFNVYTSSRRRGLRPTLYFCYNIRYYTTRRGTVRLR